MFPVLVLLGVGAWSVLVFAIGLTAPGSPVGLGLLGIVLVTAWFGSGPDRPGRDDEPRDARGDGS